MNKHLSILLVLLLLSSTALAQNGYQFGNWKPSLNDGAAAKPKRDCGALVSLTGYEFSVETAALVPASGDLPEYCHYAFRAVHVTAETSKKIIREYSGAAPARSYFDGCSTGGRQGLISAQRFPDDFDGIVVGAPVLNFTGTMTKKRAAGRSLCISAGPTRR